MSKLDHSGELNGVSHGLSALDAARNHTEETYRVWACDNQVYGPVSWSMLVQWAEEARVLRDTWIYLEAAQEWRPAQKLEPPRDCFPPGETTMFLQRQAAEPGGVAPEEL